MANATISRIFPVLNRQRGGRKHYTILIEGTNLADDTKVTAKKGLVEWDKAEVTPHGVDGDLLLVRLKRKTMNEDPEADKEIIRQIEEITVTVTNPGQTTPESLTLEIGTFTEP